MGEGVAAGLAVLSVAALIALLASGSSSSKS